MKTASPSLLAAAAALLGGFPALAQEPPPGNPPPPHAAEPAAYPEERPPQPPAPPPHQPDEPVDRPSPEGRGERERGRPGARPPHLRNERGPDRERQRGPGHGRPRSEERGSFSRGRDLKPTPYIGVVTVSVPPAMSAQLSLADGFGLLVDSVLPDSPAHSAGLQKYDVLKLFNDQQLVTPTQLAALVRQAGKDAEVTLTVLRKGQEQKLTIKIGEKLLPDTSGAHPADGFRGPVPQEFRERFEQFRRTFPGGSGSRPGLPPDAQERLQGLQKRLKEYQEAVRKWHDDVRRWQESRQGEMPRPPEAPKLDVPGGERDTGSVQPTDILQDIRPGRAVQVRDWSAGTSRWDTSRARVKMVLPEGEMELAVVDGQRTLNIRTPEGETVFANAVDTPEQRDSIPEPFRSKLAVLETPPSAAYRVDSPLPSDQAGAADEAPSVQ